MTSDINFPYQLPSSILPQNPLAMGSSDAARFVIAIDFGTTGTAVISQTVRPGQPYRTGRGHYFTTWPPGNQFKPKVPSLIAFRENNSHIPRCGEVYWGCGVRPGMSACAWPKVLLDFRIANEGVHDSGLLEALNQGMFARPPETTPPSMI
ncbi:hypothetical protein BO71DRAFT_429549 [Aspergillus ellipticus CBS 707.79]|uniref:Actin-like ATPase domain-containing protein n=1 Tax=Aspergillus ellipticus CBS 707.79 TaxID=1448320 RepID=A0A319DBV4_9EURO|nr:hypothetical protein BO71DRAFT_429549 [Aspergillus ellipticus CBS 707.79]